MVYFFFVFVESPEAFLSADGLLFSLLLPVVLLSSATFFLLPDLKSVSYQPPPFSRNAAADTFFCILDLPQAGHFFSGLSLTFCRISSSCPQLAH